MTRFGYTLMTEQSGPKELVGYSVGAEEVGFDFEVGSDHYNPWLDEQGHAPYAWSVLGAVAQATSRVGLMTYVTCPTVRYHPAIIAQKAATVQALADGRFTLGLGSGERLNEHVVGEGWPGALARQEMLVEAIEIIRRLHDGEPAHVQGRVLRRRHRTRLGPPQGWRRHRRRREWWPGHRTVCPTCRPPHRSATGGVLHHVVELGQRCPADPGHGSRNRSDPDLLGRIRGCRNRASPRAIPLVRRRLGRQRRYAQPRGFAAASQFVRKEDVASAIACGPDLDKIAESFKAYIDAGYTDVALVQVGDDGQQKFLEQAAGPLLQKLRAL